MSTLINSEFDLDILDHPDLFQVSIADKFVDMSMSSKLNKYSELIKAAA